jgi:GNAT superfamily N-acetyltransferase
MIEKSLYGQYILEREGKQIIERPEGFATYFYTNDMCYVENVYVAPEFRRTKIGRELLEKAASEAKLRGIKKLLVTVRPSANGSTTSLKAVTACGFTLQSAANDAIFFVKEIN